jgi:hypothetical protein
MKARKLNKRNQPLVFPIVAQFLDDEGNYNGLIVKFDSLTSGTVIDCEFKRIGEYSTNWVPLSNKKLWKIIR